MRGLKSAVGHAALLAAHGTHIGVHGRSSSRSTGMSVPQPWQMPNLPASSRS